MEYPLDFPIQDFDLFRQKKIPGVSITRSAFNNRIMEITSTNVEGESLDIILFNNFKVFRKQIEYVLEFYQACKVNISFKVQIKKYNPKEGYKGYWSTDEMDPTAKGVNIFRGSDIYELYEQLSADLIERTENINVMGSGWIVDEVLSLRFNVANYNIIGENASSYIDLPKVIKDKKACINIKNLKDNKCFMWCILASLHPAKDHADRLSNYSEFINDSNVSFKDLIFPIDDKGIDNFEKINNGKYAVNLLLLTEKDEIVPHKCSKYNISKNEVKIIDLLRFGDGNGNFHYCIIKDLSRLISNEVNKKNGKMYICRNCLSHYYSEERLEAHKVFCFGNDELSIKTVEEDKIIQFTKWYENEKLEYVLFADFESTLYKINESKETLKGSYQRHEPNSVSFYLINRKNNDLNKISIYLRPDYKTHEEFADAYIKEIIKSTKRLHKNKSSKLMIPIVLHNLGNYDIKLMIEDLARHFECLEPISKNVESFIGINCGNEDDKLTLRFIDSFKFMNFSLDSLVKNIKDHKHLESMMIKLGYNKEHIPLLYEKGLYPYSWFDNLEKFKEKKLPNKYAFYNNLRKEQIEDSEYEHAKKVWKLFGCKSFLDYHKIYLYTDVLHLADVFETFTSRCYDTYGIDPGRYYTAPGLAWDAMLKITGVKLDYLRDKDMILMIEKGIRGGITETITRYWDKNDNPNETLLYFDANNLYGVAMSDNLPYGGFEWGTENKISDRPAIYDVDLEYPKEIHDRLQEFIPCAHHMEINKVKKLILDFNPKTNYIIHYKMLEYIKKLGVKIININRVLYFKESNWLKIYIDLNTQLRNQSTNKFDKDFYKLMNNAVFGKTMENIRNRRVIKICNNEKILNKNISSTLFKDSIIINENLVIVNLHKRDLVFDKPIYVGMVILELSKIHMYKAHYDLKERFGDNYNRLYADTDSIIGRFKFNIYDTIKEDSEKDDCMWDTSDLGKRNIPKVMNGVLGKFKDEMKGIEIMKYISPCPKSYSIILKDTEKTLKKCKGVTKSILENEISFGEYYNSVFNNDEIYHSMHKIGSKKLKLYTYKQAKIGVSNKYDKRIVLENRIDTIPYNFHNN